MGDALPTTICEHAIAVKPHFQPEDIFAYHRRWHREIERHFGTAGEPVTTVGMLESGRNWLISASAASP